MNKSIYYVLDFNFHLNGFASDFGVIIFTLLCMTTNNIGLTACKESRVRLPGASGFFYRASDFCS